MLDEGDYLKEVIQFSLLTSQEVDQKLSAGESFYLYLGRGTCPYCREFVPELLENSLKLSVPIYYLDTSNTKKSKDIKEIRDKFGAEYVPALVKADGQSFTKYDAENDVLADFLRK